MYYRENGKVVEGFQQVDVQVDVQEEPVEQDVKENFEIDTDSIDTHLIFSMALVALLLSVPYFLKDKTSKDFIFINYISKLLVIVILALLLNKSKC